MAVDRASPAAQIANELRAQIEAGDFKPGEALPSDAELARRFDVSKPTVAKARAMLVALRLVESRAGAASVVRDVSRDADAVGNRIERARRTGRIYPEGHYARILSADLIPSSPDVAAALGISEGSPAIERQRLIYGPDDRPIAKSTTYFSGVLADRCPALLQAKRVREGTTLYVEKQTGCAARSMTSAVWCRAGGTGPDVDAEHLELPTDTCLLAVSTTTYDDDAKPIAYEIELRPPDAPVSLNVISL